MINISDKERKERHRASNKRWREKNKEKIRKKQRAYAEKNKEAIAKKRKEWCAANRQKLNANHRKAYAKNPERFRKWTAAWVENHPERMAEISKERSRNILVEGRTDAVNQFLIGDYKRYRPAVLEAITHENVLHRLGRYRKGIVFGGLLYVLVVRDKLPVNSALNKLPKEASNDSVRPFRQCISVYKRLKKEIKEGN
jgi:hypothetical protein